MYVQSELKLRIIYMCFRSCNISRNSAESSLVQVLEEDLPINAVKMMKQDQERTVSYRTLATVVINVIMLFKCNYVYFNERNKN